MHERIAAAHYQSMLLKSSQHFTNIALDSTLGFPTSLHQQSQGLQFIITAPDHPSSSIVTAAITIVYALPHQRSKPTLSCGKEKVMNVGAKEKPCRVQGCVCSGMRAWYLCCFGHGLLNFLSLEAQRVQSVQG